MFVLHLLLLRMLNLGNSGEVCVVVFLVHFSDRTTQGWKSVLNPQIPPPTPQFLYHQL